MGDVTALYNLGLCYRAGRGVPEDMGESIKLCKEAAGLGHPKAQCLIGGIHERAEMAMIWYRQAALQGYAEAQYRLVKLCMEKKSNFISPDEILKFISHAADQGHAQAQEMLGNMYWDGKIVKRNPRMAKMWLRRANHTHQVLV